MEILNLTWLFLWTISFPLQIVVKNNRVLRWRKFSANNYHYLCLIFVWYESSDDQCINAYMYLLLLGPIDLPVNCRATSITHNQFLTGNTCHTKCFSDSRKKWETSPGNETRLARNETRGGNLVLGGNVDQNKFPSDCMLCGRHGTVSLGLFLSTSVTYF